MAMLSKEFAMSALTVILVIIAIVTFIYSGASLIFYAVVLIALIVGFSNTWLLSKTPRERETIAAQANTVNIARKAPARRGKAARKRR
ncbi:MAG: hypothetical protein KGH60_00820 [Candidatus Micrarchaeota archaeon]|nr:hypothetical protein [Candidatus Micrarchaeota archaeon]